MDTTKNPEELLQQFQAMQAETAARMEELRQLIKASKAKPELTDVQIQHWLKAGKPLAKAQGEVPGLTFTLSKKGHAAWVFRYRFADKPREYSIGTYPEWGIAAAKTRALELRQEVQRGVDVALEKRQEKREQAAAKSLKELANDYMHKRFPALAEATVKQRKYHLTKIILPKLGHLPAKAVTTADVVDLIRDTASRKSINVAHLVLTAMNELYLHGFAANMVTANPCAGLKASALVGSTTPRERLMLTEPELRAILAALPSIGAENALAVKIQLATCVRISELAQAEWAHIDFDKAEWLVPGANNKSNRDLVIPLPAVVVGWFRQLEVLACGSRYVLPARTEQRRRNQGGEVHYYPHTLNRALHLLCDQLGGKVRRFTPHDLRSTARSWLEKLGVQLIVAELCLNHRLGGVAGIYMKYAMLDERRSALERWAAFLMACEQGEQWNVTALRQTAS